MAHASQCPEEGYPPQAPPGHCWGTYKTTKYLVQVLVGSLDLHGGLASRYTQLFESHCSSSFTSNSIFFFPCCPGDITFVSSVSTKVLFSHFVLPPCYPFICFPPAVSLPSWTQEPGTNTHFKVVVKPSAERRFFSQAWTSVSKPFGGVLVAITHCMEKHIHVSHLPTVFLRFDKGGRSFI